MERPPRAWSAHGAESTGGTPERGRAGPAARNRPTLAAPWAIVQTADGFCTSLHKWPQRRETGPGRTEMRNRTQTRPARPYGRKSGMSAKTPRHCLADCRNGQAFTRFGGSAQSRRAGHIRPCGSPTTLPRESARRLRKVETRQPRGARPKPARHVRSGGRACSGSMNMIMMRAWATVIRTRPVHPPQHRAGSERKDSNQPPKARSPYPQCPAAGLHTGPVHRPC